MTREMSGSDRQELESISLTPLKVAEVESSFGGDKVDIVDPSRLVAEISRKYCEPGEKIYKDDPKLKTDPVKAAQNVKLTQNYPMMHDSSTAAMLATAAAKVETAKENLNLSPKQKEHFDGVEENLIGGIPFFTGPATEVIKAEKSRINKYINEQIGKGIRATASSILVLQMATGCIKQPDGGFPTETAVLPTPIVEVVTPTEIPGIINVEGSATAPSPTETQAPIITGAGYPTSSEGFILNAGGSDEQARQRIVELGAGGDLSALEEIYKAELRRTGKNPDSYTFEAMVWESSGKVYWDSVVKDASGHYLGMKLTQGSEAGQVVRAFGLTRYIMDYGAGDDFFEFFTLQNPTEFPDAKQQMVWDNSGWHAVGLFTQGGNFLGWFNADKGTAGEWEILLTSEDLNKQEIVANINAFLNEQEQLSDKNLENKIFTYNNGSDRNEGLGLFGFTPYSAQVQGVLLGSIEQANGLWVFFGTKMGTEAERTVIPIKIPLENIKYRVPIQILYYNTKDFGGSNSVVRIINENTIPMTESANIQDNLKDLFQKPILLSLWLKTEPTDNKLVKELALSKGGTEMIAEEIINMWEQMEKENYNAYCDFYNIDSDFSQNTNCGLGYHGVKITSEVTNFDTTWLTNPEYLTITQFYTY